MMQGVWMRWLKIIIFSNSWAINWAVNYLMQEQAYRGQYGI